jgi:hypothetical protein
MLSLLRLINKHDHKKISAHAVAVELAALNLEVSKEEPTVGSDCLVAWSYRRNGRLSGGGGIESFKGVAKVNDGAMVPTNANGMDVSGLISAVSPFMTPPGGARAESEGAARAARNEYLARA